MKQLGENISALDAISALESGSISLYTPTSHAPMWVKNHLPYLLQFITRSHKFLAGQLDHLPSVAPDESFLHLPYKETYIETYYEGEKFISDGVNSRTKVLILATEHESSAWHPIDELEVYRFSVRFLLCRGGEWYDPLYALVASTRGTDKIPFIATHKLVPGVTYPPDYKSLVETEEKALSAFLTHITNQLVNFLGIISCSNVQTNIIEIPKTLQKSRLKRNQKPFFQFSVLSLDTGTTKNTYASKTSINDQGEAKRSSPCLHWRRGHIRKLSTTGKRIWVSSALIGSPTAGIKTKTYHKK